MKFLRSLLDKQEAFFKKGSKLEKFYPLFEAGDTFFYTPGNVTKNPSHVRDGLDLKRMMTVVIVALVPCILMAMYNTGLQANRAIEAGLALNENWLSTDWQTALMGLTGFGYASASILSCFVYGAIYFLPVMLVSYTVGGIWEVLFSIVRKHEVNEGFFVTGMLFPLILPPTIPLWQVAVGVSFGVVIGKEVFGGTGMNILNPALVARAFLFFSYAGSMSGNVWVTGVNSVDATTGATALGSVVEQGMSALPDADFLSYFIGTVPGSMGETSALACLIGAFILIVTRIGSWRTMGGVALGTVLTALLFNVLHKPGSNPMFAIPFWWHMVLGGWAFGTVFMATDPVSSAFTDLGKWIYGFFIGLFVVMIRVVNPAFPEGMMLAILLMNVFASTIDYFIVQKHIKRRVARHAAL